MANRWENNGNSDRLYFGGAPKSLQMVIAAMKLKTLAAWKKSYDQPRQHIKKQRHYFADKHSSSQSYGFSSSHVWMWELNYKQSWTLKNWCFALWCWRRLLRVPWTARRSNQSILKEVSPDYSLAELMLKLKLQYFGHLMQRADSLEKTLMLGKIEGGWRSRQQRMRWLDGITNSMDMSLGKLWEWWWTGKPGVLQSMGLQRVRHNWATELKWTLHVSDLERSWINTWLMVCRILNTLFMRGEQHLYNLSEQLRASSFLTSSMKTISYFFIE